jgi:alpha-glucoside transport system substrate-binding protein
VTPPKTWPELIKAAQTIKSSGLPAYSIAGANGWTLTDLFENIYLRTAGGTKYDQLTAHTIKWTDPTVKTALKIMAQVFSNSGDIYGGTTGALQIDFPTSVNNVLTPTPKAAMVFEGDFVPGVATTKAKAITDYNVFTFPSVNNSPPSVVGGGDIVVMFKDTPASRALVTYLATPEAATIRAKLGGYSSPNKNVPASAYSDPLNRATAVALAKAKIFRFDLSDLEPAAFGGTVGQGEWKLLQDFLKSPKNVDGIASQLEAAAAAAFKK